jgi:hypothetical protein
MRRSCRGQHVVPFGVGTDRIGLSNAFSTRQFRTHERLLRQRRHVLIGGTAQQCSDGIATRSSRRRRRVGGSMQVLDESDLFVFAGVPRRRWCFAC